MPCSVWLKYIYISIIYHCSLLPLGSKKKGRMKGTDGFGKSGCEKKVASQRGVIKAQLPEKAGGRTHSSLEGEGSLRRRMTNTKLR